jgi:hypothetical protein
MLCPLLQGRFERYHEVHCERGGECLFPCIKSNRTRKFYQGPKTAAGALLPVPVLPRWLFDAEVYEI